MSNSIVLARTLGLEVVAEGVETLAELDILREMGSDFVQGYFYFRPLDSAAATEALAPGISGGSKRCGWLYTT